MRFEHNLGRVAFVASAALVLVLTSSLPASANNYSGQTGITGCTGLNEADNATHTFNYADLSAHMTSATNWARTNAVNPTDVNTSYDSTLDKLTDVVVRDRHYVDYCGNDWAQPGRAGLVGLATCDRLTSSGKCEQHTVRFNLNFTESTSVSNQRSLACHEIGHTLGLAHTTAASCMKQGYPNPSTNYSDHDRAHLASNY